MTKTKPTGTKQTCILN